ncbi:hypothetical protein DW952_00245 [Ruminococcus sp. AM44-9AT]|nr:hypothetical protein DW952_00245 [Ruminococcus sp. AM44-9AT]
MKEVLGSLPEVITAYKNYNLLVPTATDVQLNPFYKFHVEEVPVDLGENSGDIFKVGSVKTGKQDERGKDIWKMCFLYLSLCSTKWLWQPVSSSIQRKHMVSVSTGLHIEHRLRELCARLTEQPEQKLTRR